MYGSALARTYYGAGDYNRAMTYAQGYYAAGGFFSKLGGLAKKAVGVVGGIASNPLVSTGLSFVPGGGLISKGLGFAGKILGSPVGKAASAALTIGGGISAARSVARGLGPALRIGGPAALAGGSAGVGYGLTRKRRRRKGKGGSRSRRVVVQVQGARRVKRKGGGGKGRRVSFRTKDGRSVSFTRK